MKNSHKSQPKAGRPKARSMKKKVGAKKKSAAKKSAVQKHGIVPLADRVLVRPLSGNDAETRLPSGIIIPETVDKERPQEGTVISVGKGKYDDGKLTPVSVKVGDRVLFSKYGYDEVKVGGVEYLLLREDQILAVLN
jgi:chaperonin GroES